MYFHKLEGTFCSSLFPLTFTIQAKVHWWFSYFKLMLCRQTFSFILNSSKDPKVSKKYQLCLPEVRRKVYKMMHTEKLEQADKDSVQSTMPDQSKMVFTYLKVVKIN